MTKQEMAEHMEKMFDALRETRKAGQAEYAHDDGNAFANFERVAERLAMSREQVLMVYAEKHLDGIHSYLKGHRSQRESIRGRIQDMILYLMLLDGMVRENEHTSANARRAERPFLRPEDRGWVDAGAAEGTPE